MSISYVTGAQATGTSAGNVTCAVGDLVIVTAYRDGSTTAPTLAAGFTNIGNAGANVNSERTAYLYATSTTQATGTWTNATKVVVEVWRTSGYADGWRLYIGATAAGGASSTTVNYPALTLMHGDGSSWVYGFAGHVSTDTSVETAPSGMTNRQATNNTTAEAGCHDTNGPVSSWASTNVSVGGTTGGWRSRVVEIMELPFRILTTGSSNTNAANYTTASVAPTASKLVTAHITSQGVNTSDRTAPSSVGGGNFTLIDEQQVSGYTQASVWRYLNASPFSGTVAINHPLTQDVVCWTLLEWANADTSGTNGSGAIDTVAKSSGTSTTPSPGTISHSGSGAHTVCQVSHSSDSTSTVATMSGEYDLAQAVIQSQTDSSWYAAHSVYVATTQQTACTPTLSASRTWGAIAFGIKQAASGPTYTLTADGNTYSLTGQAAGLLFGRALAANGTTYTLTGQAATLARGRTLTADGTTYTLTGQDAGLLRGWNLQASGGSFALTGQDAALVYARRLVADGATYALTGQDATLTKGYVLTASGNTYALSGQDAGLLYGRVLAAAGASYALTGQAAGLTRGYTLAAEAATYSLTGLDASLLWHRTLTADGTTYSLTGQDATLTYTPVGGYTLVAEGATYSLTGQDAGLLWNRSLSAAGAAYSYAGQDAALLRGRVLVADGAAYSLTGQAAGLLFGRVLNAEAGNYSLAGQDAALTYTPIGGPTYTLAADGAAYALTGSNAAFTHTPVQTGGFPGFELRTIEDDNPLWWRKSGKKYTLLAPRASPAERPRKAPKRQPTPEVKAAVRRAIAQAAAAQIERGIVPKPERFAEVRQVLRPFGEFADFNWPQLYERLYREALDAAIRQEMALEAQILAQQAQQYEDDALALLLLEMV